MLALIVYLILTALAFVWISRDSVTEEIFIVYGPQFATALNMKAWSALVSVGLRLLLLAAILISGTCLAIVAGQSLRPANVAVLAQVAMVGALFALIPWIYLNRRRRRVRHVASVAKRLAPVTKLLATDDLNSQYQPAGYDIAERWEAWHPKDELWKSEETQSVWSGVVPVLYSTKTNPKQLVFPLDWETFLVWKSAIQLESSSRELPFMGPGETRFTLVSQRKLKSDENWWILQAEMILDRDEGDERVEGHQIDRAGR